MARGINDFRRFKTEGRPFTVLTAYDAPFARILESQKVPMILVGDSLGNVVLGHRDTVAVTMDDMLHHAKAVRRGAPESFVVGDLPFLSYQVTVEDAVRNAGRMLQEAHVDAVKLEGGRVRLPVVRALVDAGIPVMGHLGLTPQSATSLGGFKVQATTAEGAKTLLEDALALQEAGVFSLVLECVPEAVAKIVSERLEVPTVGIGAGSGCDGQVLVIHDMLGINSGFQPKFLRRYAELDQIIGDAVRQFVSDVGEKQYPSSDESFGMDPEELARFEGELDSR